MNTTSLINLTAEETGQTKEQTEATVKAALNIISGVVASGEAVRLRELGTFEARWESAPEGSNADTGEKIRVVRFSPAEAFLKKVKDLL